MSRMGEKAENQRQTMQGENQITRKPRCSVTKVRFLGQKEKRISGLGAFEKT